jgi:hypothetical protein
VRVDWEQFVIAGCFGHSWLFGRGAIRSFSHCRGGLAHREHRDQGRSIRSSVYQLARGHGSSLSSFRCIEFGFHSSRPKTQGESWPRNRHTSSNQAPSRRRARRTVQAHVREGFWKSCRADKQGVRSPSFENVSHTKRAVRMSYCESDSISNHRLFIGVLDIAGFEIFGEIHRLYIVANQ